MISWFIVFSACRSYRPLSSFSLLVVPREGGAPSNRRHCGLPDRPSSRAMAPLFRRLGDFAAVALLFGVVQVDVQSERTHLLDQDVERFRNTGLERVVAAHDRFVDLGPAGDVVRLH